MPVNDEDPTEPFVEDGEGEDLEEIEALGARLGLALVSGLGFALGGATSAGMWALYPPGRGKWWPVPLVVVSSVLVLVALFVTLRRRVGRQAGDWFVLGYVGAFLLFTGVVMGGGAVQFVRDHVASSIGVPLSALRPPVARG